MITLPISFPVRTVPEDLSGAVVSIPGFPGKTGIQINSSCVCRLMADGREFLRTSDDPIYLETIMEGEDKVYGTQVYASLDIEDVPSITGSGIYFSEIVYYIKVKGSSLMSSDGGVDSTYRVAIPEDAMSDALKAVLKPTSETTPESVILETTCLVPSIGIHDKKLQYDLKGKLSNRIDTIDHAVLWINDAPVTADVRFFQTSMHGDHGLYSENEVFRVQADIATDQLPANIHKLEVKYTATKARTDPSSSSVRNPVRGTAVLNPDVFLNQHGLTNSEQGGTPAGATIEDVYNALIALKSKISTVEGRTDVINLTARAGLRSAVKALEADLKTWTQVDPDALSTVVTDLYERTVGSFDWNKRTNQLNIHDTQGTLLESFTVSDSPDTARRTRNE